MLPPSWGASGKRRSGSTTGLLHDARASLATVQALGCGAFGHVRIRASPAAAAGHYLHKGSSMTMPFLPARLVPCPKLSDEREQGVLLAAEEGVLAALGIVVGGRVEVEAEAAPLDPPPDPVPGIMLAPLDGATAAPPPVVLPPAVLNRAARGLVLAPGALLLVSHLGMTHALQVVADGRGAGNAVLVGPSTELHLRARTHAKQLGPAAVSYTHLRAHET